MSCRKIRTMMSAYVDEELTGVEMMEVRSHAYSCRNCGHELEEMARLKRLLSEMPPPEPSEYMAEKIMASVRASDHVVHPRLQVRWTVLAGGVAAIAAGYAIATVYRTTADPMQTVDRIEPTIDLRQDRAYAVGGDPFAGAPMVVPVSR
ncbi:MAG: zf-HC2 domain-containing protein [Nitrospirae bacterium]|nr:zf-HC2 domain-containing protein [Fimbriimonadaceae bacterium]